MNEIFNRRSIRSFREEVVEPEKTDRIVRAIFQAPSSSNQQSCEVVIVNDASIKEELSNIWAYTKPCKKAGVVLVLVGNTERMTSPEAWQQDLGASAENGLLQAVTEGLGAVWMGIHPTEEAVMKVKNILNLPEALIPFCLLAVGYSDRENKFTDRYEACKVHYNKF